MEPADDNYISQTEEYLHRFDELNDGRLADSLRCRDCKCHTPYTYMVEDDVWNDAGADHYGDMVDGSPNEFYCLCVPCLESRLGRPLFLHDFKRCPFCVVQLSDGVFPLLYYGPL